MLKPNNKTSRFLFTWIKRVSVLIVIAIPVMLLIFAGYSWSESGFGAYTDPTGDFQREKTLWDWLQLLIVPVVLGLGAIAFADAQRQAERETESSRVQEAAWQLYVDRMTELMLKEGLRDSKEEDVTLRQIARAHTLTVIRSLDSLGKKRVFQFLKESGLIDPNSPILDLADADFSKVDWRGIRLGYVELKRVNLSYANLEGANCENTIFGAADLRKANLRNAKMRFASFYDTAYPGANLTGVILSGVDLHRTSFTNAILDNADLRNAKVFMTSFKDTSLKGANLKGLVFTLDPTLSNYRVFQHATRLQKATMPDGKRYDGRLNLGGDIWDARFAKIDVDDPKSMAAFYGVSEEQYLLGQQWAKKTLPPKPSDATSN